MDTFPALNKLGNLLPPIKYCTHSDAPDCVFIIAWDDRSENRVCWIVTPVIDPTNIDDLFQCAYDIILRSDEPNENWLVGVAYVDRYFVDAGDFGGDAPDPVQLTADEYQAIMEAAR